MPAVVEVDELREVRGVRGRRRCSGAIRAERDAAAALAGRGPTVAAAKPRSGCAALRASSAHPGGQPLARADARVGRRRAASSPRDAGDGAADACGRRRVRRGRRREPGRAGPTSASRGADDRPRPRAATARSPARPSTPGGRCRGPLGRRRRVARRRRPGARRAAGRPRPTARGRRARPGGASSISSS